MRNVVYTENRKRTWAPLQFGHMGDERHSLPLPPPWHCYIVPGFTLPLSQHEIPEELSLFGVSSSRMFLVWHAFVAPPWTDTFQTGSQNTPPYLKIFACFIILCVGKLCLSICPCVCLCVCHLYTT